MVQPIKKTPTDAEIAEALENAGGVQLAASAWLRKNKGIIYSQQAISKRLKNNQKLKEAAGRGVEKMKDVAEIKLYDAIEKGKIAAICFYLKCKAKDRGYIEKNIIAGEVNVSCKENAASHLSDEQLKKAVDKLLEADRDGHTKASPV